jgi:hypothetical protein
MKAINVRTFEKSGLTRGLLRTAISCTAREEKQRKQND